MIHTLKLVTTLTLLTIPQVIAEDSDLDQRQKLCQLPSQNISLLSKDQTPFFMTPHGDQRLYLSLCHNLGSSVNKLCDKNAFSCITKIKGRQGYILILKIYLLANYSDGREIEFMRNAGGKSDGLHLDKNSIRISYTDGSACTTAGSNKTVPYTTNIDFLCTQV